jgi:hypothetical protein
MLSHKLKNISLSSLYKEALLFNPKDIVIGMSGELLHELYGRVWMNDKIISQMPFPFGKKKKADPSDESKLKNQLLVLAESLYNFKNIEGIQNVLENLKHNSLESVMAELESARLLFHKGLDFKFVTNSNKKGADFDIHIVNTPNDIFCEAKSKISTTIFSLKTFDDSLITAKTQFPTDNPALIMIRVPDTWEQHENELKEHSNTFVKNSNMSLGIICWYDKWLTDTQKVVSGFEVHNDKSKIFNSRLIPFLPTQPQTPRWTQFELFARGYL